MDLLERKYCNVQGTLFIEDDYLFLVDWDTITIAILTNGIDNGSEHEHLLEDEGLKQRVVRGKLDCLANPGLFSDDPSCISCWSGWVCAAYRIVCWVWL